MSIFNEQNAKLFYTGDTNVRVTLFDANSKQYTAKEYKKAWLDCIRTSIKPFLRLDTVCAFSITVGDEKEMVYSGSINQILSAFETKYTKPVSVRIHALSLPKDTWIFLTDC